MGRLSDSVQTIVSPGVCSVGAFIRREWIMWDFFSERMRNIGEPNAVRVLRYIRERGMTSQIEIARNCGLSKAGVFELVQKLMASGYIREIGMSSSTKNGGRRRVLLEFNPLSGLVIGIDIGISSARLALADLNATILSRVEVQFGKGAQPSAALPKLVQAANDLFKGKPEESGSLIGIGIGVPGVIDYMSGTLLIADTLRGWDGIGLRESFESYFNVPVYVENDVKAMTIAEYLLGIAKGIRNFIFLWMGNGVGAGIMVDGRLLRGATSSAGEIGYNELGFLIANEKEYPLLYSGQKDFGDILSEDSIVDAYIRASGKQQGNKETTFQRILEMASQGDQAATQIFAEVGKLIGTIGIILANTINPEVIVLAGAVVDSKLPMLEEISSYLKKDILPAPVQNVRIVLSSNKSDKVLLGAIGLILYELFEPQQPNTEITRRFRKAREVKETPTDN